MSGILVHLMRHGAPQQPGLLLGHRDDAPTPAGVARCVTRATTLAFDRVVSSDLRRSSIPAAQIAVMRRQGHDLDPRWRELDFGAWDGLAPHQLDPSVQARFWDDPEAFAPPGGERWSHLCARVGDALTQIDRASLIVTHGGAMRAALSVLFGFDHRQVWAFELPYGAFVSLRVWPGDGLPAAQIITLDSGKPA
ncbi:histidine phosphatase family protein [Novosphingobium sp.]|uniref:histidine phosphatase family protein n=1 Tax=Novosphingobium sp. TaxID=1874826 RepID=UPI0028A892F5|nr:histidine phosphatase family protein [Novosphingobium sp.]